MTKQASQNDKWRVMCTVIICIKFLSGGMCVYIITDEMIVCRWRFVQLSRCDNSRVSAKDCFYYRSCSSARANKGYDFREILQ